MYLMNLFILMGIMYDLMKRGTYVDNPYRNIYEISTKDRNNNIISLGKFKNNVLLIVNVNSTTTPQSEGEQIEILNSIKSDFKDQVEILVFPTNSIDNSELTSHEIQANIDKLGLDKKIQVLRKASIYGEDTCEVYKYLLRNSRMFGIREGKAKKIKKNFSKFIVNKNGEVSRFIDEEAGSDENITSILEKLLSEKSDKKLYIRNDFINLGKFI